jgi:hypothetical protein
MQGSDLVLCKKKDSIFRYTGGSSPRDVFLAPKDFTGWATLINGTNKRNSNCRSPRAIVDRCLRILIISCREIKEGEQLFYDYGADYKVKKTKSKRKLSK